MERRGMTSAGGMFKPFRNGSPAFTSHLNTLTITDGNTVEMKINSGVAYDISVFISDWMVNSGDSGNGPANVAGAYSVCPLHAGDVIKWEITPLEVTYANAATGQKAMWMIIRNQSGGYVEIMPNIVLNTIMNHGVYSGSKTVESDMYYYGVSGGIHHNSSYAASVKLKVKIWINDIRIV